MLKAPYNNYCQCGFYSYFWSWKGVGGGGMFSWDWRYCRHGSAILLAIVKAGSYLQAILCEKKDVCKNELYSWLTIYR